MAWLRRCNACRGGGFYCPHLNPDLNQAATAFPDGAAGDYCYGGLHEFQFLGQDGAVAWLLNDAAEPGELEVPDHVPPPPPPQLVAPAAFGSSLDWVASPCSPRRPALSVSSSTGSLRDSTPKSPSVDIAMAGPATSVGTSMPFLGAISAADEAPSLSAAAAAADQKATSSAGKGGADVDGVSEREARVLRYKEKRKRRRFGKQIRYASRKAYAETRPRVRGRFAKAPEAKPITAPAAVPAHQYSSQHLGFGWFLP